MYSVLLRFARRRSSHDSTRGRRGEGCLYVHSNAFRRSFRATPVAAMVVRSYSVQRLGRRKEPTIRYDGDLQRSSDDGRMGPFPAAERHSARRESSPAAVGCAGPWRVQERRVDAGQHQPIHRRVRVQTLARLQRTRRRSDGCVGGLATIARDEDDGRFTRLLFLRSPTLARGLYRHSASECRHMAIERSPRDVERRCSCQTRPRSLSAAGPTRYGSAQGSHRGRREQTDREHDRRCAR